MTHRHAGAAKLISEQAGSKAGAIASRRAAELYGLEVLDEGIQDFKENITRFIVLSRCGCVFSNTCHCHDAQSAPRLDKTYGPSGAASEAVLCATTCVSRAGTRW